MVFPHEAAGMVDPRQNKAVLVGLGAGKVHKKESLELCGYDCHDNGCFTVWSYVLVP